MCLNAFHSRIVLNVTSVGRVKACRDDVSEMMRGYTAVREFDGAVKAWVVDVVVGPLVRLQRFKPRTRRSGDIAPVKTPGVITPHHRVFFEDQQACPGLTVQDRQHG